MLEVDQGGISELREPVLVVAFDGWVSAGSAGTATAEHLAEGCPIVVQFDSDALFDYRVSRPVAAFRDGVLGEVSWPQLAIRRRRGPRDLLILSGPEPNWNWRRLAAALADLSERMGVTLQISLGGIPWAAPHTRPTVVTTTASRSELLGEEANAIDGTLEVPAAAALTVERTLADRNIETVGLWARVPHYVAGVYYPGVVTLTERVALRTGTEIALGTLVDDAAQQRRRLDEMMSAEPQVEALLKRYEDLYDAGEELASGEEIAAEFERFLRQQSDEDGGFETR